MPLDADDITNIERGIDAAIGTILEMAQTAMARVAVQHGAEFAGPLVGFIQAMVENNHGLAVKSLQTAMTNHPEIDNEEE